LGRGLNVFYIENATLYTPRGKLVEIGGKGRIVKEVLNSPRTQEGRAETFSSYSVRMTCLGSITTSFMSESPSGGGESREDFLKVWTANERTGVKAIGAR